MRAARRRLSLIAFAVGAVMSTARAAPSALAQLDALYAHRDDPASVAEAQHVADAAVAGAPNDYGTLWRAARAYFTVSDDPRHSGDERARAGKTAWELGQRAVAANQSGVEGHYWSALGVGGWAREMGVMRAIANGIEGKFTGELRRADALDPSYEHGSIPVVWAAYYLEIPWPKRDRKKAEENLRRALQINPASLRARLYLARLYNDEDRHAEAKTVLEEIAAAPVGRYDAPDERSAKREAAHLAASIK
jgi:tetratricopeptide (TPR) repeat protein